LKRPHLLVTQRGDLDQPKALTNAILSAEKLEEQRDAQLEAAVADLAGPVEFERAVAWAAFSADDDPVDAGKVQVGQRAEKRLEAEEACGCGCGS
jgi:hypothetical protein